MGSNGGRESWPPYALPIYLIFSLALLHALHCILSTALTCKEFTDSLGIGRVHSSTTIPYPREEWECEEGMSYLDHMGIIGTMTTLVIAPWTICFCNSLIESQLWRGICLTSRGTFWTFGLGRSLSIATCAPWLIGVFDRDPWLPFPHRPSHQAWEILCSSSFLMRLARPPASNIILSGKRWKVAVPTNLRFTNRVVIWRIMVRCPLWMSRPQWMLWTRILACDEVRIPKRRLQFKIPLRKWSKLLGQPTYNRVTTLMI